MKGLVKNFALSCLLASAASAAHAQSSSIVEYPRSAQRLVVPVVIDNSDDAAVTELPSGSSSEYRTTQKTPYVVEFGSNRQPVSAQPPTIRPSGLSPRIREFGNLPLEAFEPAPLSPISSLKKDRAGNTHRFNATQATPASHKAMHTSFHKTNTQLMPVEKLAIFPLCERQRISSGSHYLAPVESSNMLSGKNRPSL